MLPGGLRSVDEALAITSGTGDAPIRMVGIGNASHSATGWTGRMVYIIDGLLFIADTKTNRADDAPAVSILNSSNTIAVIAWYMAFNSFQRIGALGFPDDDTASVAYDAGVCFTEGVCRPADTITCIADKFIVLHDSNHLMSEAKTMGADLIFSISFYYTGTQAMRTVDGNGLLFHNALEDGEHGRG